MTIPINAKFARRNAADTPLLDNTDVLGGWMTVADNAERDAIIGSVRVEGLHVWSANAATLYRLDADLITWTEVDLGSETASNVQTEDGGAQEIIIYASAGGSDTTGDGTVGNPYATISRAYADVPIFISNAFYVIRCTGVTESRTTPIVLRPHIGTGGSKFTISPTDPLTFTRRNVTFEAVSTIVDTISGGELTGQVAAPTTGLRTLQTTKNYTLDEHKGRFLITDNASGSPYGAIVGNSAGPNSEIYVARNSAFTAPLNIVEPGAEIINALGGAGFTDTAAIDISQGFFSFGATGIRFTSTSTSSFACAVVMRGMQQSPGFVACQIDGIQMEDSTAAGNLSACSVGRRFQTVGGSLGCTYSLLWRDPASASVTMFLQARMTGMQRDAPQIFSTVMDTPSSTFGATGSEQYNRYSMLMQNSLIRSAAANGVKVSVGGLLRMVSCEISSSGSDAVLVDGGFAELSGVIGSGNTGVGVLVQNNGRVRRISSTLVTGSGGDYQVGGNTVGTWGTFSGNENDLASGSPQFARMHA